MKKTIFAMMIFSCSMATMAETLHIGRFASMSAKEDESLVSIEAAQVTAFASTSGETLALKGCNAGKIVTGEPGPYGSTFKSIEIQKKISSKIINSNLLELQQAEELMNSLNKSLKAQIPVYCSTEAVVAVEIKFRILNTKRMATAVLNLRRSSEGLIVDTLQGPQSISQDITLFESH